MHRRNLHIVNVRQQNSSSSNSKDTRSATEEVKRSNKITKAGGRKIMRAIMLE